MSKMGPFEPCGATEENRCICRALENDREKIQTSWKLARWINSQDHSGDRLSLLSEFFMYCNFPGMTLSSACNEVDNRPDEQELLHAEARVREISKHVFGYDIFDPHDIDSASRVKP